MAKLRVIDLEIADSTIANFSDVIRAAVMGGSVAPAPHIEPGNGADPVPAAVPLPSPVAARALPEPLPAAEAATNGDRAPVKQAKASRPAPARRKAASEPEAVAAPGERMTEILGLLRKKPMSSGELIDAMKVNSSIVYSTTHVMKEKGMIEGRFDDADGTRRWFVVKG